MTRMTKSQLVDENIKLRAHCEAIERQLAELRTQRPVAQRPARSAECVVSEYTKRDGTRWVKVRTGWNMFAHRQVA